MMYLTRAKIVRFMSFLITITFNFGSINGTACSAKPYGLAKPYDDTHKPYSNKSISVGSCKDFPITYYMYEKHYTPPFGNRSTLIVQVTFHNSSLFNASDFYVNLLLGQADCPVDKPNCNCIGNTQINRNCSDNIFQGQMYERFGVEFSDLADGNYCAEITFAKGINSNICTTRTSVYQFKGERNEPVVSEPKQDDTIYIILGTVVGVLIVICVLMIILRKRYCRTAFIETPPVVSEIERLNTRPVVKIFLIYYNDCNHHSATVKSFAEFLNANNCDVLYDVVDYNQLAINPIGWVSENLTSRNLVVIVNSSGAYQCHNLWLKNQSQQNQDILENTFLAAIVDLISNAEIKHDYNKVIHIRFRYTDRNHVLPSVCPGKHYQVPDDWKQLLCHIHGPDIVPEITDTASNKFKQLLQCIGDAEKCRCSSHNA